jgi:peptide deformylase
VVLDSGEESPLTLINPTIIDQDDREKVNTEGCLSIPGWRGEVSRSKSVVVRTTPFRAKLSDANTPPTAWYVGSKRRKVRNASGHGQCI